MKALLFCAVLSLCAPAQEVTQHYIDSRRVLLSRTGLKPKDDESRAILKRLEWGAKQHNGYLVFTRDKKQEIYTYWLEQGELRFQRVSYLPSYLDE